MNVPQNDENEREQPEIGVRSQWVVIAETVNRTMAEFAVNGLKSYDIPAALDARPGFLGTAGLQLRSLKNGRVETFKVMVPEEYAEEGAEIVKLFLGQADDTSDTGDDEPDDEREE